MEGKIVIMSVVLVSLAFLGQIQVEAKSCCPNTTARNIYNVCRLRFSKQLCASQSGCKVITGSTCPKGYEKDILGNTVNEYCKVGCMSSVCGAIITLQDSDASEVVNGAVEKCTDACYDFCTKGAVETA